MPKYSSDRPLTIKLKSEQYDPLHKQKIARTWVGESSCFQQDVIKGTFSLHEVFDGSDSGILDAAA